MAVVDILPILTYAFRMTVHEVKEKIMPVLVKHGVKYAGVFGSVARGDARPGSDVDVLVRLGKPTGLFAFIGLERELSEAVHRQVDLVSDGYLHPVFKKNIFSDLVDIYGTRRTLLEPYIGLHTKDKVVFER